MELNDTKKVSDFLHKLNPILNNKKQALIVNNPYDSAVSMLFEKSIREKTGFIVQLFSTQDTALEWFGAVKK
ncbi:MAG: hypothetical protein U9N85_13235 [Bacteroidota bacterium]|nr:hypothetical protein [Bacteroidota bacterium]